MKCRHVDQDADGQLKDNVLEYKSVGGHEAAWSPTGLLFNVRQPVLATVATNRCRHLTDTDN